MADPRSTGRSDGATAGLWLSVTGAVAACVLSDAAALSRGAHACGSVAGVSARTVLLAEIVLLAMLAAAGGVTWGWYRRHGVETRARGTAAHGRRVAAQAALVLSLLCFYRVFYRIGVAVLTGGCP